VGRVARLPPNRKLVALKLSHKLGLLAAMQ